MQEPAVPLTETNASLQGGGHHKSYAGFDPRTIKIFWEQHDQTDVELSQDVCARLAEDASYKVWELINVIRRSSTPLQLSNPILSFRM